MIHQCEGKYMAPDDPFNWNPRNARGTIAHVAGIPVVRLCGFHHGQKTHRGYRLVGMHGSWQFLPPMEATDLERAPPDGALL